MARFADYIRDVEDGQPFLSGNGEIRDASGALIATTVPNPTTGLHAWQANGSPGKITWSVAQAGQTRKVEGDATVQVASELFLAEVVDVLELFSDGVIADMSVSAPGGMAVAVGEGALLNRGRVHRIYQSENVAIAASHPTLGRIDIVASELQRTGVFTGRLRLVRVAGTPAASPVAPALTQDANINQVEVCRVTVPAAAGSIILSNISIADRPIATGPLSPGSVTLDKLAPNSVDSSKIVDGSVALVDLNAEVEFAFRGSPGLISTYWVTTAGIRIGDLFALGYSISQNTLYGVPIHVPRATTMTGIAINRTDSGGSLTVRFGLYKAGSNGLPGALHHDAGTLGLGGPSGVKSKTGLSVALPAGWYWATVCAGSFSGSFRLSGPSSPEGVYPFGGPTAGLLPSLWSTQGVFSGTGSLPGTYPAPGLSTEGPLVWIQTSGT